MTTMCQCSELGEYKEIWDDEKAFTVGFIVVAHRADTECVGPLARPFHKERIIV